MHSTDTYYPEPPVAYGNDETADPNQKPIFIPEQNLNNSDNGIAYIERVVDRRQIEFKTLTDELQKFNEAVEKDKRSSHGPCHVLYPKLDNEKLYIPFNIKYTNNMAFPEELSVNPGSGSHQDPESGNISIPVTRKPVFQEGNAIPEWQMVKFINHIVQAVFWLHKKDIIHKDIRARNVYLVRNPNHNYVAKLAFCGTGSLNQYLSGSKCAPAYTNTGDNKNNERDEDEIDDYEIVQSVHKDIHHDEQDTHKYQTQKSNSSGKIKSKGSVKKGRERLTSSSTHGRPNLKEPKFQEVALYHLAPEVKKELNNSKTELSLADVRKIFTKASDIYQLGCTMFEMITWGQNWTAIYNFNKNPPDEINYSTSLSSKDGKRRLPVASYHQQALQSLMEKCTNYYALARPEIKVVADYHMINVLSENGIHENMAACSCGLNYKQLDANPNCLHDKMFYHI